MDPTDQQRTIIEPLFEEKRAEPTDLPTCPSATLAARRCQGVYVVACATYSHVLPNMQEKAVEAMEDILDCKD